MSSLFKPHYWFFVSSSPFVQINANGISELASLKLALSRLYSSCLSIVIIDLGVMGTECIKGFAKGCLAGSFGVACDS